MEVAGAPGHRQEPPDRLVRVDADELADQARRRGHPRVPERRRRLVVVLVGADRGQ